MNIWAIGDLHLSFGVPNKGMEVFGPHWENHAEKIASHWKSLISQKDLVLIPGDISWALRLEEVIPDLAWIHKLPGTKVMIKGNHDYWWGSLQKVKDILPPSIHVIQNDAFFFEGVAIGGARLWDTPEYNFSSFVTFQENPQMREDVVQKDLEDKIFARELSRLSLSLKNLHPKAHLRIAMTHYPPIGVDFAPSKASKILKENNIDICIFGHLHNIKKTTHLFPPTPHEGILYLLTSCDYLDFSPLNINQFTSKILDLS